MIKIRVIIAGSRLFRDYLLMKRKLDAALINYKPEEIEIVSGCAMGADYLGERYATERGISIKRFPANWDEYGKSAGPRRNEQMAQYGTHCMLFWNGISTGTRHMASMCKKYNLKTKIIMY